jgi:hypothetical protein
VWYKLWGQVTDILATYEDKKIPKILFLHHIPNRQADFPDVMTLRDWKKLMDVVGDKVDVLAFGHQGKLEVAVRGKLRALTAQIRPMQLRILDGSRKRALKRTWVLDANDSVTAQSCYSIRWDGEEIKPEMIMLGVPSFESRNMP